MKNKKIFVVLGLLIAFVFGVIFSKTIFSEKDDIKQEVIDFKNFSPEEVLNYFNLPQYLKMIFLDLNVDNGKNLLENKEFESKFIAFNTEAYSTQKGISYEEYAKFYKKLFGKPFEYTNDYNAINGFDNCKQKDKRKCRWYISLNDYATTGYEMFTFVPFEKNNEGEVAGYVVMSYVNSTEDFEYIADFKLEYETNENALIMKSFIIKHKYGINAFTLKQTQQKFKNYFNLLDLETNYVFNQQFYENNRDFMNDLISLDSPYTGLVDIVYDDPSQVDNYGEVSKVFKVPNQNLTCKLSNRIIMNSRYKEEFEKYFSNVKYEPSDIRYGYNYIEVYQPSGDYYAIYDCDTEFRNNEYVDYGDFVNAVFENNILTIFYENKDKKINNKFTFILEENVFKLLTKEVVELYEK